MIQLSTSASRGLSGVKSTLAFLLIKYTSPNENKVMINPAARVAP